MHNQHPVRHSSIKCSQFRIPIHHGATCAGDVRWERGAKGPSGGLQALQSFD